MRNCSFGFDMSLLLGGVTGASAYTHKLVCLREKIVNHRGRVPVMAGAIRSSSSSTDSSIASASFPVRLRTCSFCSGVSVIRKVSEPAIFALLWVGCGGEPGENLAGRREASVKNLLPIREYPVGSDPLATKVLSCRVSSSPCWVRPP